MLLRWSVLPASGEILFSSIGLFTLILIINKANRQTHHPLWNFLSIFYPIIYFIILYPQACAIRNAFFPMDFDPFLVSVETSVFILEWYRVFPAFLPVFVMEMFHGIYLSYYIALALFAIIAWKNNNPLVTEYLFVLSFTMIVHQALLILIPASGPVFLRGETMPEGFIFIPAMNWIYSTFDRGGGAFPSLHVAAALVMVHYANRFFIKRYYLLHIYFILISVSTVICSFHYTIDVVIGFITGWISLLIGSTIYSYFYRNESR